MNKPQTDNMLPEYNLEGKKGVRGKYAKSLQKGYSIRLLNEDGTITDLDEFDALIQKAREQAKEARLRQRDIETAIVKARKHK
jgi:hypothetical protein